MVGTYYVLIKDRDLFIDRLHGLCRMDGQAARLCLSTVVQSSLQREGNEKGDDRPR